MRPRAFVFVLTLAGACSTYGAEDAPPSPSGTNDGGPVGSDAAGDAPSASDAAAGPFCASRVPAPFFCADFDDGKPADFGFNDNVGEFAVDTTTSTSPPGSLVVRVAPGKTGGFVARRYDSTKLLSRIALTTRMRWNADHGIPIRLDVNGGKCAFDFTYTDSGWLLQGLTQGDAGDLLDEAKLPYYPVPGEWTSIEIVLTKPNGAVVANMKIGGKLSADNLVTRCPGLGIEKLQLGIQYGESGDVHFDDVALDGE